MPQFVPAVAFDWLQVRLPVLQLAVPGLQVVPHGTPAVQAMQLPEPLQTWFVPHAVPPEAFD